MGMIASAMLLLNSVFLSQLVINPQLANFMLVGLGPDIHNRVSTASMAEYFYGMSLLSLLASLVFFIRPFINLSKYSLSYITIFMLLHVLIIYWYAFDEIQLRTFPMTQGQCRSMDFCKVPFEPRRADGPQRFTDPRAEIIVSPQESLQELITDSVNNFTFSDVLRTKYRTDFYTRPFYRLLSAFKGGERSSVFKKLAGAAEDKVQFFSQAYCAGSDEALASKLSDKTYAGDMLFYRSWDQGQALPQDDLKGLDLSQHQRLVLPYKVLSFSPDQIVISVDVPKNGVWMQYSDNWHPSWKARINGHLQKLYIGSLAYKALPLPKGKNIIRMYVESKPVEWLYAFFMVSSLAWMVLLICLLSSVPEKVPHHVS
jgi:hypothetical protein